MLWGTWALSPQNLPHLGHFNRKICSTWGTLTVKSAPPGVLSPQILPHLGHFLRKMCPTWGTLRDPAGHPWPGGGAIAPFAPPLYPPLYWICPTSMIGLEASTFFSIWVSASAPPTVAKYLMAYLAETVLPAPDSPDTMIDWFSSNLQQINWINCKMAYSKLFLI